MYRMHEVSVSSQSSIAFLVPKATHIGVRSCSLPPSVSSLHHTHNNTGTTHSMHNLDIPSVLAWGWRMAPVVVGSAGGYLFYRFVGCKSGVCPITRSPWLSTIYGAILGALFIWR